MVKKMGVMETLGNVLFLLGVIFFIFVKVSGLEHKELSIEDPKLCSPITKRKVRYESLMVNQGWSINQHSVTWNIPNLCKFEVQSTYSKGGIVAVIQKLNLRKNADTGECIDYIQFRAKKGSISRRHCGLLDARIVMNYYMDSDDISYSMADANTFMDVDGELDVIIFIAKEPLSYTERTEFLIVFTSYKNCSEPHHNKHITLLECVQNFKSICINKDYFGDGHINCPYYGCADEMGCFEPPKSEPKGAVAKRVIIGSISTFGIIFGVFIILIWAFKKHKLFCWAEDFAHPTPTPENNRNSRVMEMNEQTGARLAETVTPEVQASAPVLEEDKDLPPSYDSLFPNPRKNVTSRDFQLQIDNRHTHLTIRARNYKSSNALVGTISVTHGNYVRCVESQLVG